MPPFDLRRVRGHVTIGTGRAGSRGHALAREGAIAALLETIVAELSAVGGGTIEVLPGVYPIEKGIVIAQDGIELILSRGTVVLSAPSGAIGVVRITGRNCVLSGGNFVIEEAVPGQVIVEFDGARSSTARDLRFEFVESHVDPATPTIALAFRDTVECRSENVTVLPNRGVIGVQQRGGTGNVHRDTFVTNNENQDVHHVVHGREVWIGFQALDTRYVTLDNFRAFGVGAPGIEDVGGPRAKTILHFASERPGAAEDGHSMINHPRIEMCAAPHYLLIEGVQAWLEVNDVSFGYANASQYALGDAGIKITRNAALGKDSARIAIQGGAIHNLGRSRGLAVTAFAVLRGGPAVLAAPGARVDVDAATSTYRLVEGEWTVTPQPGDWVTFGNFAHAANSGHHKVVAATSSTITVEGPALVDEEGPPNVVANGATAFDSAAVWIEHASEVDVRNLRVLDQRHMWGIVVDAATTRGLLIDGCTFHRAGGDAFGAVAPLRIPSATLPPPGPGYDDASGMALRGLVFKGWGSPLVPVADAFPTPALTAVPPTFDTAAARWFPDGLADAAGGTYAPKSPDTSMTDLSTLLELDV